MQVAAGRAVSELRFGHDAKIKLHVGGNQVVVYGKWERARERERFRRTVLRARSTADTVESPPRVT